MTDGMWFGLCMGAVALAIAFATLDTKSGFEYDCKNYGKTEVHGKWYECKPIDKV